MLMFVKKHFNVYVSCSALGLLAFAAAMISCSDHVPGFPDHGDVGVAVAPSSISGNGLGNAGPTTAVSGGANTTGVVVPTATAIAARIQNGLQNNVDQTQGNFAKAYALMNSNLPNATDVTKVAGYDQAQLLVYAACADLTIGDNPAMKSSYNVDPNQSATANQSALVAAGMQMLDQHVASLASQGPAASQLSTIFTNLVQSESSSNSSTVVFMTVCIAANTAGAIMLGI